MQKANLVTVKIRGNAGCAQRIACVANEGVISALGWFALAIILAYANRRFVGVELNEVGDFAANSLLIQDAKHLQLWVGHYSRIGFNHPGPFILYVLAVGEWLLFDCLHLVKSPLAGQIFAVSAFNAWWLMLIGRLLFRMLQSLPAALSSWVAILAFAAYVNHGFLNGLWFPDLFFWPFTTYCLALTRLAAGKADSLAALALSCGALVHGHVAFVAICGIMLVGALMLNWLQRSDNSDQSLVFSLEFIRLNRKAFVLAAMIGALFLLPIIVETIKNFPGPIPKYAGFSSANSHNGIGDAMQFLAYYWAFGFIPLIGGMGASFLIATHNKMRRRQNGAAISAVQNAIPILLLATVAMLIYAIVGIDDLSMPYVGLFYFSIPALTIALIVGYFFLSLRRPVGWVLALVLATVMLPFVYRQAALSPGYAFLYEDPNIPNYFSKVEALGAQTLALDLDDHEDWKNVWKTLLGVEVYAARHGRPNLFCVHKHWYISFAEKARCSAEQLKTAQRLVVSAAPEAAGIFGESLAALGNIHFYKAQPLRIPGSQMVEVAGNKTLFTVGVLQSGWSAVSEDFAWSEGKVATLAFDLAPQRRISALKMDIAAFLPHADSTQSAKVVINGVAVDTFHFTQANNRAIHKLILPVEARRSQAINIELYIASPTSPKQAGIGSDPRLLGVALYGIELENAVQ